MEEGGCGKRRKAKRAGGARWCVGENGPGGGGVSLGWAGLTRCGGGGVVVVEVVGAPGGDGWRGRRRPAASPAGPPPPAPCAPPAGHDTETRGNQGTEMRRNGKKSGHGKERKWEAIGRAVRYASRSHGADTRPHRTAAAIAIVAAAVGLLWRLARGGSVEGAVEGAVENSVTAAVAAAVEAAVEAAAEAAVEAAVEAAGAAVL